MGLSKAEKFTSEHNRTATLARAMSHPARVAILEHLAGTGQCVCGDLVDVLPLSQSTVSQHLKELKTAGIIQGTIAGTNVCYCINPNVWSEASSIFAGIFSKYKMDKNCC